MGKSLSEIQALMGHRSIVTTMRYLHHFTSSLKESIKALDDYYETGYCHNSVTPDGVVVAQWPAKQVK